ncbi:MAG: dihydropyrimidinase, partial [Acidobacteriota bacterium]|nr:dihydropyrimidinase [Acidobacteriota bacterium]
MSRLLVKGGRVVTAVDDYLGDVLIEGSTISAIFAHGQAPAIDAPVVDATGKLVIPGGIDAHTHL